MENKPTYPFVRLGKSINVTCSCGEIMRPVRQISIGAYEMYVWQCVKCQRELDDAEFYNILQNSIDTPLR